MTNFSVVGLGKLGASMAAAIADRGFKVIGVDVNHRAVDSMNAGHAPVQETDLEKTIIRNKERLSATLSHQEAIVNSDVSFVVVPTPSDEKGAFSLQYAAWACKEIGRSLYEKDSYHLVVLTSTVLPGSTRYGLLPVLERESRKKCGKDFGLCYSPEFIALGSIIHDFLNPDFTLVGEFDKKSGALLETCYKKIMVNNPPCKLMSIENAELAKIALNTYVTTKITYANMLADLCERIPGGDVDVVTEALGTDTRIGIKYLKGAFGYGGPCFPRDNVALSYFARTLGTKADIAEATHFYNKAMVGKIVEKLKKEIHHGDTVAILGLSYKPYSHVLEESQGVYLAQALIQAGIRVVAFDPLAGEIANVELEGSVLIFDSLQDCLDQADIVLITTPDPAFKVIDIDDFKGRKVTVVDFWRILSNRLSDSSNIRYIPYGRSINESENAERLSKIWNISNS
ncbi:UDP-glucose dehydrogenase family protein [Candidatus Latescibacterota bacterium]